MYPASAPAAQSSLMRSRRGRLRRRRRQRQLAPAPALVKVAADAPVEEGERGHDPDQRLATIRAGAAPRHDGAQVVHLRVDASQPALRAAGDAGGGGLLDERHEEGRVRAAALSVSPRASSCSSPNSRTVSSIAEAGLALRSLLLPTAGSSLRARRGDPGLRPGRGARDGPPSRASTSATVGAATAAAASRLKSPAKDGQAAEQGPAQPD